MNNRGLGRSMLRLTCGGEGETVYSQKFMMNRNI
jgi:hypothetical protein